MSTKNKILSHWAYLFAAFVLLSIIILLKIVYLKTLKSNYYKEKASVFTQHTIKAKRGNIYDINGNLLATTIPTYDIYFDPKTDFLRTLDPNYYNQLIDSLAEKLAENFPQKTKKQYLALIKKAIKEDIRGIKLLSDIEYLDFLKLKTFPIFKWGRIKGGLIYEEKGKRYLIYGEELARRTIGFFSSENKPFGIERIGNSYLSGTDGIISAVKLRGGYRPINELKKAQDGSDVISTIDIRIQDIVENSLKKRLIQLDADYGVAIVMDVKTGEIRALANLGKIDSAKYFENRNYAVGTNYEPGSVMKLASFILVFEKHNVPLDSIIDTDNGIWKITNDYQVSDYKKGGFGKITVKQVFEVSSNVGTAKLVDKFYGNSPEDFLTRFMDLGFAKPLNIDLEDEANPIIITPGHKLWNNKITLLQMSIGYSISVSPMHIITFYNAIANDGVMLKPQFIKRIEHNGKTIKEFEPVILNPAICSKQTLNKVRILLKGVVENGTGKNYVKSQKIQIAGKSGTAWSYSESAKGYHTEQGIFHNATFVGYFPADKPKYTCLVMIHNPKKVAFSGSSAAGVVVKEIAEKIYAFDYDLQKNDKYIVNNLPVKKQAPKIKNGYKKNIKENLNNLNINYLDSKTSKWVKTKTQDSIITFEPINFSKGFMPDVRNMSLKDALFVLKNYKLNVIVSGSGKVVSQSIRPNEKIYPNQIVLLKLK